MKAAQVKSRSRKKAHVPEEGGSSSFPQAKHSALFVVFLIIAIVALYFPVTFHPFVNYDDGGYILHNQNIKNGLTADAIAWAFSTFAEANWHPLTWISHAMDISTFGLTPGGPHDINVIFHVINALLLFWVLKRATRYTWRSLMVAALFALHPINVETVAWISERKNLLSMLFFLLAMGAYRWWVEDRSRSGRYLAVAVLFGMGLMAKPQIITLPFVLLLWDYWPLRRMRIGTEADEESEFEQRGFWSLVREKIPLFAIAAASAVITMVAQRSGGAVLSLAKYPLYIRVENAIVSYARYVMKAFWPAKLAPLYPHPVANLNAGLVVGALAFLIVVTALVVAARQRRYLLVGWLWFLGTLVPMIGLVQVGSQAMADRYAYLPLIGLFLMVCWGIADWTESLHVPMPALACGSAAILVALIVTTHRQLNFWSDNGKLWAHTLEVTGPNYIAEDNLAGTLMDQGKMDEAMGHFQNALAIYADDPTSNMQIAMFDHQHGNFSEAILHYQKMIDIMPNDSGPRKAEIYNDMGYAYRDLGDLADAKRSFDSALALDGRSFRALLGAGLVAQKSGDVATAAQDYSEAVAVQPSDVGYLLLANALQQSGQTSQAQAASERAKMMSRNLQQAQHTVDGLLAH